MPDFDRATFLGATVTSVRAQVGWNGQQSTLTIDTVEDDAEGDVYTPVNPGTPGTFTLSSFVFRGILQKYESRRGIDGNPIQTTIAVSPEEILEGTKVIIGGYSGSISPMKNIINAYGYHENLSGFGGARINETGMPWSLIRTAIHSLTQGGVFGSYGGPIVYAGYQYEVDLSELPAISSYYRVNGTNISLLELISQVAQDGAYIFFTELQDTSPRKTIKVRAVSTASQPALGTIAAYVNSQTDNISSNSRGVEGRNEVSAAFLTGGEATDLSLASGTNIVPFWGLDLNGNAIVGTGTGDHHIAPLNAAPIADIIGSTTYNCNVREMRCALAGQDMWETYIAEERTDIANIIGMNNSWLLSQLTGTLLKPDFINFDKNNVINMGAEAITNDQNIRQNRMFEFVRKYAQDYYGKKFVARIPDVSISDEPETNRVLYSHEPTDGAWTGTNFGITTLNAEKIKLQDGRFAAFCRFNSATGNVDFSQLNTDDGFIQNSDLYLKCNVNQQIIFVPSSGNGIAASGNRVPAVVATLSNQVRSLPPDEVGDISVLAAILHGNQADIALGLQRRAAGTVPLNIGPEYQTPYLVAVPLKSNILTYGPWYSSVGATGKIIYEQDKTLVPWNYNGTTLMNTVAQAKVDSLVSHMFMAEAGHIERVGLPTASLGDVLQAGGPQVTNIEITYGPDGAKTSYRFETYTQRFGNYKRYNAERVKYLAQLTVKKQNETKEAGFAAFARQQVLEGTYNGWLANAAERMLRQSPHEVMLGIVVTDGLNQRVGVSTATTQEALPGLRADNTTEYQRNAMMSTAGMFRPFSTSNDNTFLPSYKQPSGYTRLSAITGTGYNPFRSGNDIEIYTNNTDGSGIYTLRSQPTGNYARVIGLRGPIVITGWGYDIHGNRVPAGTNFLKQTRNWPTGPVDHVWEPNRGVWTSRDLLLGYTKGTLSAGGSINMEINNGNQVRFFGGLPEITIYNFFSTAVSSGAKVIAGYNPYDGRYYVIAADC